MVKITFSSLFFRGRDPIPTRSSSLPSSSCVSHPSTPSWAWPSCKHPRTDSFRDTTTTTTPSNDIYKTTNSVYFDSVESWFTNSSEEHSEISISTASEEDATAVNGGDAVEAVIRGLRSERLIYEPAKSTGLTSSIVEEEAPEVPFGESVAMVVESENTYRDFRSSMEEMVAAQGMRDQWERLEELLVWYLRVNGEKTHGYIVKAFVDLVVGIALADHTSTTHHDLLASSSSSCSPSVSFEIDELKDDDDDDQVSSSVGSS